MLVFESRKPGYSILDIVEKVTMSRKPDALAPRLPQPISPDVNDFEQHIDFTALSITCALTSNADTGKVTKTCKT